MEPGIEFKIFGTFSEDPLVFKSPEWSAVKNEGQFEFELDLTKIPSGAKKVSVRLALLKP